MQFGIIFFQILFSLSIFLIYPSDNHDQNFLSNNHSQDHGKQWQRMANLGKKFDIELEKAQNGLSYQFTGIFKAMNRLSDKVDCPTCQKNYRSLCKYNKEVILANCLAKLASGKLPKQDDERGHYV